MLPIRTSELLDSSGRRVRALTVFCPRHERSVSMDDCRRCGSLVSEPRRPTAGPACITCSVERRAEPRERARPILLGCGSRSAAACVGDAAGWYALSVRPDVTVVQILGDLSRVRRVVVTDCRDQVVGTIAASDAPADPYALRAADIMLTNPVCLPESAPLSQALGLMVFRGVHVVHVVHESGTFMGILTDVDALRWVARRC